MLTVPHCVHLVDDDEAFRKSLQLLLTTRGLTVLSYPSAEAFLSEAEWTCPGCLVLDLRMPGLGGERLLTELVQRDRLPTTIVLTAHGSVDSAVRSLKAGAVEFVDKSMPPDELIPMIERAIEADAGRLERQQGRSELQGLLDSLSPRERDVLEGVMQGLTTARIAERLGLQAKSVELYRSNVLAKLRFATSAEMMRQLFLHFPERWRS